MTTPRTIGSINQAFEWLKASAGKNQPPRYRALFGLARMPAKSTWYQWASEWCPLTEDRKVTEQGVRQFINQTCFNEYRATSGLEAEDGLAKEKAAAELEKLRLHNERAQFQMDVERGKYLPREEVEMMLAERVAVFDSGLKHLAQSEVADWVHLVHGKADHMRDLLEVVLAGFDRLMDEYSRGEFEVEMSVDDVDAVDAVDGVDK